jgi:hypothetical protein
MLYQAPSPELGAQPLGSLSASGKSDTVLHHEVPTFQGFSCLTGVLQAEPTSGTLEG